MSIFEHFLDASEMSNIEELKKAIMADIDNPTVNDRITEELRKFKAKFVNELGRDSDTFPFIAVAMMSAIKENVDVDGKTEDEIATEMAKMISKINNRTLVVEGEDDPEIKELIDRYEADMAKLDEQGEEEDFGVGNLFMRMKLEKEFHDTLKQMEANKSFIFSTTLRWLMAKEKPLDWHISNMTRFQLIHSIPDSMKPTVDCVSTVLSGLVVLCKNTKELDDADRSDVEALKKKILEKLKCMALGTVERFDQKRIEVMASMLSENPINIGGDNGDE